MSHSQDMPVNGYIEALKRKVAQERLMGEELYVSSVQAEQKRRKTVIIGCLVVAVVCLGLSLLFGGFDKEFSDFASENVETDADGKIFYNNSLQPLMYGAIGLISVAKILSVVAGVFFVAMALYKAWQLRTITDRTDGRIKSYQDFYADAEQRIQTMKKELEVLDHRESVSRERTRQENPESFAKKGEAFTAFAVDMGQVERDENGDYILPLDVALENLRDE